MKSKLRRASIAAATMATLTVAMPVTFGASAASAASTGFAAGTRVDLRILVVRDGTSTPWSDAIDTQLGREGVPHTTVDLADPARPVLDDAFLQDTIGGIPRSRFESVVLPSSTPLGLSTAELDSLHALERTFGVRQVSSYVYPSPALGTNWPDAAAAPATKGFVGVLDGVAATLTPAALAGPFQYLKGSVTFDNFDPNVSESFGAAAVPLADTPTMSYQPLLTMNAGGSTPASLAGVLTTDGREEMLLNFGFNANQNHFQVLGSGIVDWMTRGVHLGFQRNYLSVHVDDVFLPDDRWQTTANCTYNSDCPAGTPVPAAGASIRMNQGDVLALALWQAANGIKLDLAYNGAGADQLAQAGTRDPLTQTLVALRGQFRWVNHTYSHAYLGCQQDWTTNPWQCATDASGAVIFASQADITAEIQKNLQFAASKGIAVNSKELVTGEHSGLRLGAGTQMPGDNPNFAPALTANGVTVVAADNSRETTPRLVGSATTLPRYPMNIFYNAATVAEEVDEYNAIYTRADQGGRCVDTAVTTCMNQPLTTAQFTSYIVPLEARIATSHVLTNDPRPHYAHQSNLTEGRVLYPVLNQILSTYRATFASNTPIVNPTMSQAALQMQRTSTWQATTNAASVDAYVLNGQVVIRNVGGATVEVPVTVPNLTVVVNPSTGTAGSAFGSSYAGLRSAWQSMAATATLTLQLPG